MFYHLSKVFWFLCAPSHIGVWLILIAAGLLARKRERAALRCALVAGTILILLGFSPVSVWMMHPIENLYPRPALPAHVDGIIILGGGNDGEIYGSRGAPNPSYGVTRLMAGCALARQHPEARVVFSGGPFPDTSPKSEARAAREILIGLGLAPNRVLVETASRNTWENFRFSQTIAKPRPGETWVVVTSAFHMPRTLAIAAKTGWPMLPWPSDYTTASSSHYEVMQFPENLERADLAVHEGIGVLAYRLAGNAH